MANTTVTSNSYNAQHGLGLYGPFWSDKDTAIIIHNNNFAYLKYSRTTNAGVSWTLYTVINVAVAALVCYYDKENTGDTGNKVHIVFGETIGDVLKYTSIDVKTNSKSADVVIGNVDIQAGISENKTALCKTKSNNLIFSFGGRFEQLSWKSINNGTSWTAIAVPTEGLTLRDHMLLFPANTADNNDACCFFWDSSANEISIKMYDDSANTWTETIFITPNAYDSTYLELDGVVRHSDNHIIFVTHANITSNTHDLQIWDVNPNSIASPVTTKKTNVFTAIQYYTAQAIVINQQNDDIYVAYSKSNLPGLTDVVFKKSTDGATTWGTEQAYSDTQQYFNKVISGGRTVGADGGRVQFAMQDENNLDILINLVNDIEIIANSITLVLQDALHSHLADNVVVSYNPVTVEQEGFRFRLDNGTEITATWIDAQDINITRPILTPARIRFLIDIIGNLGTKVVGVEFKRKDEAVDQWRKV